MPGHDIVVVGASAGGVEALIQLVGHLPADLPAALFIVLHIPAYSTSLLPQILSRYGFLPAAHPKNDEAIQQGRIYIAPPDHHLLVQRNCIRLSHDLRENGHRPSIDSLFRSAAQSHGQRVVGVVLSGMLSDGAMGLAIVKAHGGVAIVQDLDEAIFNSMPLNAIESIAVDHVLTIAAIARRLEELAREPVEEAAMMSDVNEIEPDAAIVAQDKAERERGEVTSGAPSPLTCPDCGGVLWELRDHNLIRYRCHIGHAYSIDSLLSEQADAVETAFWSAIRALEEKAALARRMASHAQQQERPFSEQRFLEQAETASQHAVLIRGIVTKGKFSHAIDDDIDNDVREQRAG